MWQQCHKSKKIKFQTKIKNRNTDKMKNQYFASLVTRSKISLSQKYNGLKIRFF